MRLRIAVLNEIDPDGTTATFSNGVVTTRYTKFVRLPMKHAEDIDGFLVESALQNEVVIDKGLNNFERNQVLKMSIFTVLNMRQSALHDYLFRRLEFDCWQNSECLQGLNRNDLGLKYIDHKAGDACHKFLFQFL